MTDWLSPEWFDEVRALGTDCPKRPDLSGIFQCELTGAPTGTVRCYAVLEDGRLQSGSPGRAPAADGALTASWDDGVALTTGSLDPNVAFMQGRLKVTGSMALMLALLSAAASEAYRDFSKRLAAVTDF
ncbi:MAG: SCP2 sterol-binding domain-containing protein [Acidimicrobiales bacterium]